MAERGLPVRFISIGDTAPLVAVSQQGVQCTCSQSEMPTSPNSVFNGEGRAECSRQRHRDVLRDPWYWRAAGAYRRLGGRRTCLGAADRASQQALSGHLLRQPRYWADELSRHALFDQDVRRGLA